MCVAGEEETGAAGACAAREHQAAQAAPAHSHGAASSGARTEVIPQSARRRGLVYGLGGRLYMPMYLHPNTLTQQTADSQEGPLMQIIPNSLPGSTYSQV